MIETVMFIALGFVAASLIALLLAPAFWRRAVRLTTRKIEATMPISVSDINADKDLLRAEYAVEIRRLELALEQARQRAARHLMERNRHMVDMGKLESEIASLKDALAERTKAGSVMEQTVRKRLPELEEQLDQAHQLITAREQELAERARAYENQTESLELAQAMIRRQEQEIDRLRESLEAGTGAGHARWGKSISEDEAGEALAKQNGELRAELSRLRERLAHVEEVDRADVEELRSEMQRLATLMLSGVKAEQPKSKPDDAKPKEKVAAKKRDDARAKSGSAKKVASEDKAASSSAPKAPSKQGRKTLLGRLSGLKTKSVKEPA